MVNFKSNKILKQTIHKSKFICFNFNVYSVNEVKEINKKLWTQYPDATHICYAYILGNNQEVFFYSDDGEPSKTAGLPIYLNMKKSNLSYCMIAIVRYFGGIEFGTSNLRETFSNLAKQTIESCELTNVRIVKMYRIDVNYDQIKNITNKFNNCIIKKEFLNDKVSFYVYENENNIKLLKQFDAQLVDKSYPINF